MIGFEDLDEFQDAYFEARDNGEDVELLFEEVDNPTATFLTGTDVIAARVPPARPVRAPDNLGKALQAPPDEVSRACAVCIRNATGRRLVLYAGAAGGTLKRRATIDAHDATLQHATTAELWLAAFDEAFKELGAEKIDEVGVPFDPTIHEAAMTDFDENAEPDTVIKVFQYGVKVGDRLIRPATVVVSM